MKGSCPHGWPYGPKWYCPTCTSAPALPYDSAPVAASEPVWSTAPVWTEERVKRLLDTLDTISRRLGDIEYSVRTRR